MADDDRHATPGLVDGLRRVLIVLLVALLAHVVLRAAWVGDDAYITFRTIDNALDGYGLRWNVAERVQSYTHPLWLLLLTPIVAVVGNPYLSALGTSLVLTSIAVGLTLRGAADRGQAWLPVFVLSAMVLSKAFTDYATSGLENALSHALLAALMWTTLTPAGTAGRAGLIGTLVALIALVRLDLVLLAWPIGLAALRSPRRTVVPFLVGHLPLVLWEIFSVVYYGVPVPNTAYAKLATGVPREELLLQGLVYVTDSLTRDPVTLFVIAGAILAGLLVRTRTWVPAAALALYLAYVVWIGGDFMTGRFYSSPLVVALCLFARLPWPASPAWWAAPVAAVVALGLSAPKPTLTIDAGYQTSWEDDMMSPRGVVDERGYYFPSTGWLTADGLRTEPRVAELRASIARVKADNPRVFAHGQVGMAGYYTGPDRYIVDTYALSDPLLARLPATTWRIGHFERRLPAGYLASIEADRNLIEDPALAARYETIRLVTRGPIWSWARWKAIVALNTGGRATPTER